MRIAVIGAGAMGAMTGAKLCKSGQDVTLVDVWKDHVDEINNNGLLLRTKGDEGERIHIKSVCSTDELEDFFDLVIVFVKGIYTADAISAAKKIIGPDTYVFTMQNGVGNADVIADYADPKNIVIGTTTASAALLNPGEVNDTTEVADGIFTAHITSYLKEDDPRVYEIAEIFTEAGINTEVSDDAEVAIWEKLAVNCCLNAPCMLARLNCGAVTTDADGIFVQDCIIRELVTVAQVKGIPLSYSKIRKSVYDVFTSSSHYPSMAQDAYKKAKTEIETITGAVVREGMKYGIPTPVNEVMYHLVKLVENNYDLLWY